MHGTPLCVHIVKWKYLLCLVGYLAVSLLVFGHQVITKNAIIDRPILDVQLGVAQSNVSDTKPSSKKAYVKAFHYSGQQATAIRAMDSLQCFLRSMKQPFALVEPYITAKGIQGFTYALDRMTFLTWSISTASLDRRVVWRWSP